MGNGHELYAYLYGEKGFIITAQEPYNYKVNTLSSERYCIVQLIFGVIYPNKERLLRR